MSASVADDNCTRAAFDSGFVKTLYRFGIATSGVLGDIHHLQAYRLRKLHRRFRGLEEKVSRPVFSISTDRTRPDESCDLNGNADFVLNFRHRANVVLVSSRRAIAANLQLAVTDLPSEAFHVRISPLSSPRQPHIKMVDSKLLHQMENAKLLLNRGIFYRRRLEPIAQRLVGKQYTTGGLESRAGNIVPVVDQV